MPPSLKCLIPLAAALRDSWKGYLPFVKCSLQINEYNHKLNSFSDLNDANVNWCLVHSVTTSLSLASMSRSLTALIHTSWYPEVFIRYWQPCVFYAISLVPSIKDMFNSISHTCNGIFCPHNTSISSLAFSSGASMTFRRLKFTASTSNLWPVISVKRCQCRGIIA